MDKFLESLKKQYNLAKNRYDYLCSERDNENSKTLLGTSREINIMVEESKMRLDAIGLLLAEFVTLK